MEGDTKHDKRRLFWKQKVGDISHAKPEEEETRGKKDMLKVD